MRTLRFLSLISPGFILLVASLQAAGPAVRADEIGGVVTSSKGPEAGVWVIAETADLPTKFRKIVVTDDQGRYLLPELPRANYRVWVRGYGLVDSKPEPATPGKTLALTAVIAPDAQAAAQYYPANYWYSLMQVPPRSDFPGTGPQGNGIDPGIKTQVDWVWRLKSGCESCHQVGDAFTRQISPQLGTFPSTVAAWDHRMRVGQDGAGMSASITRLGRGRALDMLADWTDRIKKGEIPPAPPRPQGVERNVVLTLWEWGDPVSFAHDEIATDKNDPTRNANGPIYGTEFGNDKLLIVDPVAHSASELHIPVREAGIPSSKGTAIATASPVWGDKPYWNDPASPHAMAIDGKGRVWITSTIRQRTNQPAYCKEGSDLPSAKLFPLNDNRRELAYYDPKTKEFTFVDTCFDTAHLMFARDKDETVYSNGVDGGTIGWVKTRVLDATHDVKLAQGWCGSYIDVDGDGKFEPGIDQRVNLRAIQGIATDPTDINAVWGAIPGLEGELGGSGGSAPGRIVRVDPRTCATEVYEPPFNNPKAPGKVGFGPRGIDVDTNGVVWTGLSGSGDLASFDRRKCKVPTGPATTDGQHCVEGWTLYPTPGPRFKGVTDAINTDTHYYSWVDLYDTLGLGKNVPMVNGSNSDSLIAMLPGGKFVTLRVPFPMGFFQRSLDGRIDDSKSGWKGRGMYADYGPNAIWAAEGGKGTKSNLVKFQIRPNPLAD
jgi:hypothetical protein